METSSCRGKKGDLRESRERYNVNDRFVRVIKGRAFLSSSQNERCVYDAPVTGNFALRQHRISPTHLIQKQQRSNHNQNVTFQTRKSIIKY